ncbi:MAG: UDP-N-acetylmuramoyl-L-alanyl-D-glutamate--2,6-diaminopimelate ligase [Candidatus Omnitrophica bacterium]|nr:UDP-N-acetylmuramoyl-L-alanyl-D-glutamate--2,6-diaminopimelate ligase [Candidatus Omnitrophota bacterium]
MKNVFNGPIPAELGEYDIPGVWDDSRRVTPGSLFAALSGPAAKGEDFIPAAVEKGARVVMVAANSLLTWAMRYPNVFFVGVPDPRAAFEEVAREFYGHPASKVRIIGVTGTNGKTTITYLLESILKAAGRSSGVIGTVNYRVQGHVIPSKNTTPGFLDNQIFLKELVDRGVPYAVIEASSHALHQARVSGADFRGGIFTNLTGDHLDYHRTMDAYFAAKAALFTKLDPHAWAVVNVDDAYGRTLPSLTQARVLTYAVHAAADVRGVIEAIGLKGTTFTIEFFESKIRIETSFIGLHNVYNILAAFAAALADGIPPETIRQGIECLPCVPGRLERVEAGQDFFIFIDYAHTDDGLKNVLEGLQAVRHKKLIVVFGCGGDRDRTKRPRMGKVACDLADHAIITSDNPRSEDPQSIIDEVIPGFTKKSYECVVDRQAAIERALTIAEIGDIVLLAGKGHETYQVLKDRTIDFVERDIVERFVRK